MYEKSRGIVLYTIPYNDTLSVVHIYTERYGHVSYTLPRGVGRAAKMSRAMYMPLSLLEMEIEVHAGREMQRIREARTWIPLPRIQCDPVRTSLAMFISEFLGCLLRNNEAQPDLFAYVARSIELLDKIESGVGNFHLCFLVGLSSYIGITPNCDDFGKNAYFDMQEGVFVYSRSLKSPSLPPIEAAFIPKLLRMNYANMHKFKFSRHERASILDRIILYYNLHLPGMKQLKSPAILHAIFD